MDLPSNVVNEAGVFGEKLLACGGVTPGLAHHNVLMPADYGAPAVLPARADRAASLPLVLSASEAAALPPIAGYRVEAFYP